jgi:hypothetical protein
MRYATTERRGISPKVSRPRGLKRHGPIGRVGFKLCSLLAPCHWVRGASTALPI